MTRYANTDRAVAALSAFMPYKAAKNLNGEDNETVMGDLLTDLMHACDLLGLDFVKLTIRAEVNHAEEVKEEAAS